MTKNAPKSAKIIFATKNSYFT